jgi:hypothetical protein
MVDIFALTINFIIDYHITFGLFKVLNKKKKIKKTKRKRKK